MQLTCLGSDLLFKIFIRTQYLHFPASCSSKKTKARKNKGEINAELKQTGFCFSFFQQQPGYVMRRIRRETLQIGDWISFQSVHPHQLIHLFLYASSASENWIMEVFWNVLLLPSEIYIYIYIYIYTHIYTCFHPPRTYFFISFATGRYLYTHILMDSSNPSSVLISPWFGIFAHLCSGHALLDIHFLGITCECATELAIIVFIYYYYCCIYIFGRCINVFYQSWRSKPWPWDHYASWAPWIVNW